MRRQLLAILACVSGLFAQDYRAKVQGIVTDSTDAVIPGAKVTLTNNGTGISASEKRVRTAAFYSITSSREPTP